MGRNEAIRARLEAATDEQLAKAVTSNKVNDDVHDIAWELFCSRPDVEQRLGTLLATPSHSLLGKELLERYLRAQEEGGQDVAAVIGLILEQVSDLQLISVAQNVDLPLRFRRGAWAILRTRADIEWRLLRQLEAPKHRDLATKLLICFLETEGVTDGVIACFGKTSDGALLDTFAALIARTVDPDVANAAFCGFLDLPASKKKRRKKKGADRT